MSDIAARPSIARPGWPTYCGRVQPLSATASGTPRVAVLDVPARLHALPNLAMVHAVEQRQGRCSRAMTSMLSARQLGPLGLLAVAGIAFIGAGGHKYLSFTALAENRDWLCSLVERWGVIAALLYIAVYCLLVALSVPGAAVLTIAGGYLFGTWLGTLCAVIGATLGATAIFLAARAGLGGLAQRAGRFVGKLEAGFRADAFNYLIVLRLVPVFPFWLVNLVPALVGVRLPTYVLATFLGIIPGTFVYASLGNGLGNVVEEPDLAILFKPRVLVPIVGLALLALAPVGYKRWRAKKAV
jgi:uncharacterized membrane protein YdjX (TVP38/TMEM64 family)